MHRRTLMAMALGAAAGAIGGLGVLAMAAARLLDGGLGAVVEPSGGARAEFLVSQGGLFLLVIVAGLLGGAVLGALGYVVARETEPDAPLVALGPLTLVGSTTGLVLGLALTRAMIGLTADISGGIVTLSVSRATIVTLVVGAATGLAIGGGVERLSNREIYGFEGEAWPANPVAFARDAFAAVGLPVLALVVGAAAVWGLSVVLLEVSTEAALVVFGGVAAVVLGVAAFVASHPPQQRNGD